MLLKNLAISNLFTNIKRKQISKSVKEYFQVIQNKKAATRAKKAKVILEENTVQAVPAVLSVYPLAQVEQVAPLAAGQVAQLVMVVEQEAQDAEVAR